MKKELLVACFLMLGFCFHVKCHVYNETSVEKRNCSFVLSNSDYDEFVTAIPLFEKCVKQLKTPILFIKLTNCNLPAFPDNTFTNMPLLKNFILHIEKSQVNLLSPWMSPCSWIRNVTQSSGFKNLKFVKAKIEINNSVNLIGWNWIALLKMQHKPMTPTDYLEFNIRGSKLVRLDSSFGEIAGSQVNIVKIVNCQLRWLGRNVFGPLSNLNILDLRKNFLETFERSHLPDDASKLKILDLGRNRLQYISEDFFDGLQLATLRLDRNNIKFLISQIDKIVALPSYLIDGNLLPCDCRMLKKVTAKQSYVLNEKCYKQDLTYETVKNFLLSCEV